MSNTHDELLAARRAKLESFKTDNPAYPNDFPVNYTIGQIVSNFSECSEAELEEINKLTPWTGSLNQENIYNFAISSPVWRSGCPLHIAGRIKLHRVMGKTSFCHIVDHTGTIQLYLKRANTPEEVGTVATEYDLFKKLDLGDIIGVTGWLYRTQKGELSVKVISIRLLTKALQPLPDKFHGLTDHETRYRQRYLDLMVNPDSVAVFKKRSEIIREIRETMELHNFMEVETPMMHSIPGGATARPFMTHHNALDMDLFLRIAPELYLKRLVVGGFTRVFELNRSFRNEGLSPRHNPEFTMMEFYAAYWDYNNLMSFLETLIRNLVISVFKTPKLLVKADVTLDFSQPFQRLTMLEAVLKENPWLQQADFADMGALKIKVKQNTGQDFGDTAGTILSGLFEKTVESTLVQPTFITEFPIEISPLARRNDKNKELADRFELFMCGQELANGFSELNDPDDQAERFRAQVASKAAGNDEAMHYDADYIAALEYGLPPTAGAGIGIDRLVMMLLGQDNIRDVVLFPQMRNK